MSVATTRHGQKRIIHASMAAPPNPTLVNALVNAHRWYRMLMKGQANSIAELAHTCGRDARYIRKLLVLVYLAPDIKRAILKGQQPIDMTLESLTKTGALPVDFDKQRSRWGMTA